jgi:hypothetical protein
MTKRAEFDNVAPETSRRCETVHPEKGVCPYWQTGRCEYPNCQATARATPLIAKEETPPTCRNCGYPRSEHHVGQGWCIHGMSGEDASTYDPASQPSSSSEIREAIEDFHAAILLWAESAPSGFRMPSGEINAARSRLESLYLEQLQEIERLRERHAFEKVVEMGDEVIKERVDAMFPRDSQLTDAELHFLYGLPLHPGCAPECQEDLDRICERLLALRALSTKGAPEK